MNPKKDIGFVLTAAFVLLFSFSVQSQVETEPDTLREFPEAIVDTGFLHVEHGDTTRPQVVAQSDTGHSPALATWMSAALPGLGQVYNGKWWKVPIIYAGFATTTYFIIENNRELNFWSTIIEQRYDPNVVDRYEGIYSNSQLFTIQNAYRRLRDLNIILTVALYGLQILDANVDAHLYHFDVSDDIALDWQPNINTNTAFGTTYGARIVLSF